jgi:uncharacterized protein
MVGNEMNNYRPPAFLFNSHLETIYPSLFRKVKIQPYQRERIGTPDDDFLDLDWLKQNAGRLVIISHGLEGNTERSYIKGMAKAFYEKGFDVLAWNYRGCSGEMNKQLRFYHSGATDDLETVINHASADYDHISLVGFSLGGNLTLKLLGEKGSSNTKLKSAVALSVPMDLHGSCLQISKQSNWIYQQRFLKSLKAKIAQKSKLQSGLDLSKLKHTNTLMDFDDHFTAPLHGFGNAIDYYQKCSSIHFIKDIKVSTLIINAKNDPFLSKECYPNLSTHPHVRFEMPVHGGHVGFSQFDQNGLYWSELMALEFIQT